MKPGEDLLGDPVDWGRRLIETQDHDPLYTGLIRWNTSGARRRRFMLAYWCCYSVGASWWLSQHSGTRFWDALAKAAANIEPNPLGERWPRAHERRHWRGLKAITCVEYLQYNYKHPEEAVLQLETSSTFAGVVSKAQHWPQFGPWIAFKAADMLECVLGCEIDFPPDVLMYDDPRRGAEMAGEVWGCSRDGAVHHLLRSLGDMTAPTKTPRPVGIQEVETVLCKWKSARGGRYWIGADTHDHRAELTKWGAQDLLAAYPTMQP